MHAFTAVFSFPGKCCSEKVNSKRLFKDEKTKITCVLGCNLPDLEVCCVFGDRG